MSQKNQQGCWGQLKKGTRGVRNRQIQSGIVERKPIIKQNTAEEPTGTSGKKSPPQTYFGLPKGTEIASLHVDGRGGRMNKNGVGIRDRKNEGIRGPGREKNSDGSTNGTGQ